MKRLIILFFAFSLLAVNTSHAQRPTPGGKHGQKIAKSPEMRKEIREYTKTNILPTMRQQRAKLEADLSTQEKTTIADIRASFKADKKAMHAKREEMRQAKENGTADLEAIKTAMKALRMKHQASLKQLNAIAKQYETRIQTLREEIKPSIEQWKIGVGKIVAKYAQGEEATHINHRISKSWNKGDISFLLMDTQKGKNNNANDQTQTTQVYPNPAQNTQQLKIELTEAGLVKIEILDKQGNPIQTVFEGNKTTGEHVFTVNTSKLATGNYLYRITTPKGVSTKKIVVKQ